MAQSILSSITSKVSFVAINEITGHAIWTNLKIIDVDLDGSSQNTDYPVSLEQYANGTLYKDLQAADVQALKVQEPTKVVIHGICPDISTIGSILSVFSNTMATVAITSKGVYSNTLSVVSVEIDQDANVLSAAKVTINLERTLPTPPTTGYAPAQGADFTSAGSIIQTLSSSLTSTVSSLYNTVSSAASSALSAIP